MTESEILALAERAEAQAAKVRNQTRGATDFRIAELYAAIGKLARHIYENTD